MCFMDVNCYLRGIKKRAEDKSPAPLGATIKKSASKKLLGSSFFGCAFRLNDSGNSQIVICAVSEGNRCYAAWQFKIRDVDYGANFGIAQINFDKLWQVVWQG